MNRMAVAEEMVLVAKELAALEAMTNKETTEEEDPVFVQKVRELKQVMQKLNGRKAHKLTKYGVEMLKPAVNTVEDLVDALRKCVA